MTPPQILDYMGISVQIPTNDHLPIHIHAYYSGKEYGVKAELEFNNGNLAKITYKPLSGCKFFPNAKLRDLGDLIKNQKDYIKNSWVIIFVDKKKAENKHITKRI